MVLFLVLIGMSSEGHKNLVGFLDCSPYIPMYLKFVCALKSTAQSQPKGNNDHKKEVTLNATSYMLRESFNNFIAETRMQYLIASADNRGMNHGCH